MLDQRIYLKHTTETTFPTTAAPSNAGMTLVFQGDITWTEGWFTINLTTPFAYNGTDNLMILLENYDGDYVTGYPTFRYTSTSSNYRSKYKGKDGSYPTTDAGTRTYYRPNIKFTSAPLPDDGALLGITNPSGPIPVGNNPVAVTFQNQGNNNITSATIDWDVSGTPGTPYTFNGNLAPGASVELILGTANFIAGNNIVNAEVAGVNGGADGYAGNNNVTGTFLGKPAMSGNYTIGTGGDYANFNAAVAALNASALAGPVVFNVFAGTYNEYVSLSAIANTSATNTVTFQSVTGVNTSVVLTSTASSTVNYTVRFDGADYVRFKDMTIETDAAGTTYGRVVVFQNSSDYNSVENCILNGVAVPNGSSSNIAVVYGTNPNTYNKVINNVINNGSAGVYFTGSSSSSLTGSQIIGNTINGPTYYGVYGSYMDDGTVSGNSIVISNNPYSTTYGIYMYYPDGNVDISGNDINVQAGSTSGYGIYCYYGVGSVTPGITLFNNAVILTGAPTTNAWGIGLNVANARVYHNTVSHQVSTGTTSAGLYINSTSAIYNTGEFVNNLISCFSGAPAVNITSGAVTNGAATLLNYNNLYTNGSILGLYGATNCADLAAWKTATGQEANSRSLNPSYVSATNLTPESYSLDNKGTPLPAVPKDINGTNRSATTPDIGAIEFVAPTAAKIALSDTFWNFGAQEYGKTYTKTIVISNVGASAMYIPPVVDVTPFFCNINSLTTVGAGNSINCVITFTPTTTGVYDVYLNVTNSSSTPSVKIHLKGESFAPGSLVEDFEGPIFPPLFWTVVQPPCAPTTNAIIRNNNVTYANSPTNALRFSASGTCAAGYEGYVITPQLITTAANRKFSFWYRRYSTSYAESLIVGWSSTGKDVNTDFTWGDTLDVTNTVHQQYVKTDLPIGTKYVAIRYASGAPGYYVYVDDVFGPPVYYEPYLVDVTGLTPNQTVPATVSYNYKVKIDNYGANADNFQLSVPASKGFTYTIRNKADNATISNIAIPSMQADTVILKVTVNYGGITEGQTDVGKLMVVSSGNATVRDSAEFTTTVAQIPVQPPYLQDFPTTTFPPSLWTEMDVTWGNPTSPVTYTTGSSWTYDDFGNVTSPSNRSARVNLYSTTWHEWLVSPIIDLGSTKSGYRLEFDLALTEYADTTTTTLGIDDTLALVISLDGGISWRKSNTLMLWHNGTPISPTGDHISVDLSAYSNAVRLGFYAQSTVSNADNDIFIDNFYVFDPTSVPLCTSPVAPVDDATFQEAGLTLSWTPTGNTTGYKLYFGTTDPPPFHSNLGNVTSFNTGALSFGTEYFWKVVPYNAVGDATGCDVWSFTTMPVLTVPYVQDFSTYTSSSTPVLWKEAAGKIGEPTTFTSLTTSNWLAEDFVNTPSHPNGTCAGINIYGTGRFDWLLSPLFYLGSGNNKLEFDLALTKWNNTAPDTLGIDDTLALVISLDTGKTWLKSNILQLWHAGTIISDTGDHITINLSAYTGVVQFGFYGVSTITNKDNDIFIDNFSLLADGILGLVTYDNAAATPLTEISVNIASPPLTATTGMDGRYGFMPIANGTYNITGSSTAETGSINTTDALWVVKHVVGLNLLSGMPLAAAETDNIAGITANDALQIQRRYVKLINTFPAGDWKFETVTATVNNATVSADFKGIATGDVNRSFVPGAKAATAVMLFEEGELNLSAGRLVDIPVYSVMDMGVGAISLMFDYPAEVIEIQGVSTAYRQQNLMWAAENGRLVISWMSLEGASVLPGSELLSIRAVVKAGATPAFRLGEGSELADRYGEVIFNAALSMPKLVVSSFSNGLTLGCYPNPTSGATTLSFSLETSGDASL
jgi:hypothetical protein